VVNAITTLLADEALRAAEAAEKAVVKAKGVALYLDEDADRAKTREMMRRAQIARSEKKRTCRVIA
jgi:hypothetical protein